MKLVVSKNKYDFFDYTCTKTLQDIDWTTVDALIYHSSVDSDVDAILELSKAGESVEKMIYINNEINALFYALFAGIEGDIYDDESYLYDDETLNYLVNGYKNTGSTMKSPNVDVGKITKLLETISTETPESLAKKINNPNWMKSLETSIKNVETALVRTDEANVNMVEMFNKTSEIIETLKEGQTRTTEEIEKLSKFLQEIEKKSTNRTSATIEWAPFTVPNTVSKVLHIHVCSSCKFLFSFLNAYQDYLKMNKQISTKMIIAAPKLKQFIKKYEGADFARLDSDTLNIRGIENSDLFVTYEPKAQVWTKFFSMRADVFIVIDTLYGEPLLKGAKVTTLSAISGLSDIKRYNLEPKKCIVSNSGLSSNIVIPTIPGFAYTVIPGKGNKPTNITTKRSKYFEKCKDNAYLKLDGFLGV